MLRSLNEAKQAAARALFESGTVVIDSTNGFELKIHERYPKAPRSPIYVSMRPLGTKGGKLSQSDIAVIGEAMTAYSLLHGLFSEATFISGIPAAGEPFTDSILSYMSSLMLNRLYLVKTEAGGKRYISDIRDDSLAHRQQGDYCLLIDDLVTGADTKLEAIQALRNNGVLVKHLLVFLDRSSDAAAMLAKQGVTLHALWSFDALMEFAVENGYISQAEKYVILSYPEKLRMYIEGYS